MALVASLAYESFFGLSERPFNLTPDPKYYFRSRSHARAFEALVDGLSQRQGFVVATGDLGVGKTTLCRAFAGEIGPTLPLTLVANPLISPEDLLRLLLGRHGGVTHEEIRHGSLILASGHELRERLHHHLTHADGVHGAALIIDEAQRLPASVVTELVALSSLERAGARPLTILLVGQSSTSEAGTLALGEIDRQTCTRVSLLPLDRDECGAYVEHRLGLAGAAAEVTFSRGAIDQLFDLSGGVPRLVNLLCERALQKAALVGVRRIEPPMVDTSATELELRRPRPRRFRWFSKLTG